MTARTLESDYQRALMAAAAAAFREHRFFRRNTGMIRMKDDRFFRASIPGQCDLYVLGRGGWHGEVELKRYGKLSEAQEQWRDWCLGMQVPWLLLKVAMGEAPSATIARWLAELKPWLEDTRAGRLANPAGRLAHPTGCTSSGAPSKTSEPTCGKGEPGPV